MKALYWNGQTLGLESGYAVPKADERTAVVRVRLAGVCSTDLQILRGYMGFRGIPGHEFVGEVVEGPGGWSRKRVVGEINFSCGQCEFCVRSLSRHCPERRVMGILGADGSFAEYVAVPVVNLHEVPDAITDADAVFVEPLAAAFEILEQVRVRPQDDVLVLGDGKLGLLCAQVLGLTGARVTLVGKHPAKLGLVGNLGIQTTLLSDWKTQPADVVVEATGSTTGLGIALRAVRPRGTLVLKSTLARDHTLSLAPVVIHEVTVVGSRCGPFPPALEALRQSRVRVAPLISKVFPLANGLQAVACAASPEMLKVLIGG